MNLIFLNHPASYKSFIFQHKRNSKEYEAFFGPMLGSQVSEDKRNANIIVERIAKLNEPKSIFEIEGGLKVDFNKERKNELEVIIDDFIQKLKYKKYKNLSLWIPLLQDHFWNNVEKPEKLKISKPAAKKGKSVWEIASLAGKAAAKPRYTSFYSDEDGFYAFKEEPESDTEEIEPPVNESSSTPVGNTTVTSTNVETGINTFYDTAVATYNAARQRREFDEYQARMRQYISAGLNLPGKITSINTTKDLWR